MAATDAGSAQTEDLPPVHPPPGWARVDGLGDPADIFHLDAQRPDFPKKWRVRHDRRERMILAESPHVQAQVEHLREKWGRLDFDKVIENIVRASEVRANTGRSDIADMSGMLLDGFRYELRRAAEASIPDDVMYQTAIRYLAEQTLPAELVLYAADADPAPLQLVINREERRKLVMSVAPGETVIKFRGIGRSDLNQVGRFITEAVVAQDPARRGGKGGRPTIAEATDTVTPEMVARLFYWEGWSQRRIAAFLGWLRPDENWDNPKVRMRVEQRVRRWLRLGEGALRAGEEEGDVEDDVGIETWKRRPPHLEQAVAEQGVRRRGR